MSSQAPSTEPSWSGWIETTGDALLILEAARRGLIPRLTRRLVDTERKMITSGSVFVFDEKESGIKRWTDGFFWTPSRILGNFLLYRETEKRGPDHRGRGDGVDDIPSSPPNHSVGGQRLSQFRSDSSGLNIAKVRERPLRGRLTNSYKPKTDGLMKKTFSLNIDGVAQHLISYYRIEDVQSGRLRSPSTFPELASLDISPELLDKTHFRDPPKVEVGPDGILRYRGEAGEIDQQPALLPGPLSTGLPLLTDGRYAIDKQAVKRYDPYGSPSNNKHLGRAGKCPDEPSTSGSTSALVIPPVQPSIQQQPLQTYPDSNVTMGQAQTQQVTTPITLDHNASENGNGPIFTAHFTPSESSPSKTWATATVESDNQEGCSSLASTSNQAQEDTFFRLPYSYQNSPSSGLPKNSNTIVATPPELVSTYSSTDDETPYTHAVPQEPQIPPDLDAMSGYNLQFITRDLDLSSPFDFVSKSHQHQLDQAERRSSYSTSTLLLPIYPLPSTPTDSNRRPLPILPAVQQLRDSASVRSSQRLSIQSARITSRFCLDDSFVRGLMSSESETSLSPPICVPQTVSGSSTLLNTGYEDPVTDSDNETVTVPGTCIQANFLSDSDGDSESPYPQSSQKVPHHTSLLSPVQVAFIPGPTVDVEGDDKDVAQSRSRLARIPKANKQGTGTLDSDTPELSHPSGGDYDGASPEAESTLLDTLRLSVTGSNAASIPDKNPVILSDEVSEVVSADNPNIHSSSEAIKAVEGLNVLQKATPINSSELTFQALREVSLELLRPLTDNETPDNGSNAFPPGGPTVYRSKRRSRGEISLVWHLFPHDWGGLTNCWSRDGTPRPNDPPETFKLGRQAAYQRDRKSRMKVDPIWFLHHHDWGPSVRWATYRRSRRLSKRRSDDFYDWINSLATSWSSSPPGAFQNSSDFGIYGSTFVACEDYHMTTNNYNYPLGPGNGGVSPEELLKQIQVERRMLELERRIMQLERDNLNKERLIFNYEQEFARLRSRSPPGPEPPPDPHAYHSHNDYRNSPSSTPYYTHHPPSDFYADYDYRYHGSSSHSTPYTHHPPPTNYDHGHRGSSSSRHPNTHHRPPVNHANSDHGHPVDSSRRTSRHYDPSHDSYIYDNRRHSANFPHSIRRRHHPYSRPGHRRVSPIRSSFDSELPVFDASTQNINDGCTHYGATS